MSHHHISGLNEGFLNFQSLLFYHLYMLGSHSTLRKKNLIGLQVRNTLIDPISTLDILRNWATWKKSGLLNITHITHVTPRTGPYLGSLTLTHQHPCPGIAACLGQTDEGRRCISCQAEFLGGLGYVKFQIKEFQSLAEWIFLKWGFYKWLGQWFASTAQLRIEVGPFSMIQTTILKRKILSQDEIPCFPSTCSFSQRGCL